MVKSNQQVIEAYEKNIRLINEGADEMYEKYEITFEEMLEKEKHQFDSKRLTEQQQKQNQTRRQERKTPVLPKSYTDNLQRYRTIPYMTRVTDMNVFKR